MHPKKYILWDNDGILVETERWYYEAGKKALADMHVSITMEQYQKIMVMGASVFDLAKNKGFTQEEIEYHRSRRDDYYREYLKNQNLQIPFAESVVAELSLYFKMAIVTSSRREDFDLIHRNRNFVTHMDFILASGEYPRGKPFADPYLAGLEKLGASKDEVVVVEDSQRGLTSALAAGLDCIIIENQFTKNQDFTGAAIKLKSIRDLINHIPR